MSNWAAEIRRREAERRREEREARQRQKEVAREIKERVRLLDLGDARLEVEVYESAVEELLSVHKERGTQIDWIKYAVAMPPHEPLQVGLHEFHAQLKHCVAPLNSDLGSGIAAIEEAHLLDEQAYRAARDEHAQELVEWTRMCSLAKRVLAGQVQAYSEAIAEFAAFSELPLLGSVRTTVHGSKLVGCTLRVKGREVVPTEAKSLTASGKLSSKAMSKARFQEIYQGYVCGCLLRVAREMFALLPVNEVLLTAKVDGTDDRTGNHTELPIFSAAIKRAACEDLNFERLDPWGAMENFLHRGDVKTTRRSGELATIVPLTPKDLMATQPERMDLSKLLTSVRQLRAKIEAKLKPVDQAIGNEETSEQPLIA